MTGAQAVGAEGLGAATTAAARAASYAEFVKYFLHTGRLSVDDKARIWRYREEHRVTEEEHATALQQCGWTAKMYDIGRREADPSAAQLQRHVLAGVAEAATRTCPSVCLLTSDTTPAATHGDGEDATGTGVGAGAGAGAGTDTGRAARAAAAARAAGAAVVAAAQRGAKLVVRLDPRDLLRRHARLHLLCEMQCVPVGTTAAASAGAGAAAPVWHMTRNRGYRMTYRRDDWVGAVLPAVARTAAILLTGVTVATGVGALAPGLGRFLAAGLADLGGAEHVVEVLHTASGLDKKWVDDYQGECGAQYSCGGV